MKTARQFYLECETPEAIIEAFKEFAKMHVEAFKKEIKEKAWYMCEDNGWDWHVEVDRVNSLYSPENII